MKAKFIKGTDLLVERRNHKLLQEDLASKLGVSIQTISRWERLDYLPSYISYEHMTKLEEIFDSLK